MVALVVPPAAAAAAVVAVRRCYGVWWFSGQLLWPGVALVLGTHLCVFQAQQAERIMCAVAVMCDAFEQLSSWQGTLVLR